MKIALVFPPFYLESMYNLPPLGLVNLASSINDLDHKVELIDFVLSIRQGTLSLGKNLYEDCASMILEKEPDLVGFSAQCATYPSVIQISRILKEKNRRIKIVAGGHNASFLDMETIEKFPYFDSFIRGEGEITFRELINSYEEGGIGEGIPGVTYREGGKIIRNRDRDLISDLDTLPAPDYSILPPFSVYRDACNLPRSIAILEVGRGCPYNCIYCSESIMWQRRCRTFSVPRLVNEMMNLSKNFGAECFLLAYDQFTSDRAFVESFCRSVIEKGLHHLPWYCISRLDSVDASLLKLMKDAGCESMCYGIDSGSKRTLAFIRKRIDKKILHQRVIETAEQGLIPTLSFVIGFPEEEKEDIDQTLELALMAGIVGNNNPLIQMPTVLPGTDLHKRYKDLLIRRVDTYFALGLEFDNGRRLESDEKLINSDPSVFSSFYNLPCPGLSLQKLNIISSYFSLMVQFFPKTFFLLCRECDESVSDLFINWFKWVNIHLKRKEYINIPRDFYLHFEDFVSELLEEKGTINTPHIYDIIKYEKISLEAAGVTEENQDFTLDIKNLKDLMPRKNNKVIIAKFDFDISVIIIDLKEGIYNKRYPNKETFLSFMQEEDILDVYEIDLFTKDFLESSDGKNDFDNICEELFPRYGKEMTWEKFYKSCVESLEMLVKMGFIVMH
ncbi:B12-binding domain-containing radical SAM protein [Thermodesulfobacteriota bacterium]